MNKVINYLLRDFIAQIKSNLEADYYNKTEAVLKENESWREQSKTMQAKIAAFEKEKYNIEAEKADIVKEKQLLAISTEETRQLTRKKFNEYYPPIAFIKYTKLNRPEDRSLCWIKTKEGKVGSARYNLANESFHISSGKIILGIHVLAYYPLPE